MSVPSIFHTYPEILNRFINGENTVCQPNKSPPYQQVTAVFSQLFFEA